MVSMSVEQVENTQKCQNLYWNQELVCKDKKVLENFQSKPSGFWVAQISGHGQLIFSMAD